MYFMGWDDTSVIKMCKCNDTQFYNMKVTHGRGVGHFSLLN